MQQESAAVHTATYTGSSLNVEQVRTDFPILRRRVRGKQLVYLDNAATAQKPRRVIDALNNYYCDYNANVHRAIHMLGERATQAYEAARAKVGRFINARSSDSIVFTRGATEAINLVAYAWGRHNLSPGDEILITEMEHHSNIVPWQLAARDTGATLRYIPIRENGTLDLDDPDKYFTPRTKLVAVVHQSNVFGSVNPIEDIIGMARQVGALVLVDGAQSVPHFKVDVQALDCDFLAFSSHKMMGPTGAGALYGKRELLESMEPFLGGGEMIGEVTMEGSTWNDVPWKFEAGTPNIAQAIGLGAAIDYINDIGIDAIHAYEKELTAYALEAMRAIPGLRIFGDCPTRGAVVAFEVAGIHPHDLAQFLDQEGIAIRAGHHCAQPIMRKLKVGSTARASFYLYNTKEEIDLLCQAIEKTQQFFGNGSK